MNLRPPYVLRRNDGAAVAQFTPYPAEASPGLPAGALGVLVRLQEHDYRETRLVGPITALRLACGLVNARGWWLREGRP
jgi:hypothetical protein